MTTSYFQLPKPRFFAHRGASAWCPENTLLSFEKCAPFTKYIETDCWLSLDGTPYLQHDSNTVRTCGKDFEMGQLNDLEIQKLDAGYMFSLDQGQSFPFRNHGVRIPTLQEALSTFKDHYFNIEIKDPNPKAVGQVLDCIQKNNATNRCLLAANNHDIMKLIRELKPASMATSVSHVEAYNFIQWFLMGAPKDQYRCEAQAFQIPYEWQGHDLASPEFIMAIHKLNCEVHYWTVNDRVMIRKLLDAGADGIVSDFPNLAEDCRP